MELSDIGRRLVDDGAMTVLVDGRSGSGKTTFAAELQSTWGASTVVHLDDVYPGWDGLRAASEHVEVELLAPRRAGRPGRWRRWDWSAGAPAEWHLVEADQPVVVEGCGALTVENRALADLGIWLDCAESIRKHRALTRDGATFAAHWDRWAEQECAHIARNSPRTLADVVLTVG